MKKNIFVVLLILCLGAPGNVFAAAFSFRCKIKNQYTLKTNGKLAKPDIITFSPDSLFKVDRSTGKIVGANLDNKGNYQVIVVDSKDTGSFKVFSIAQGGNMAKSLTITTNQKENGKMPFIFFGLLNDVVTGTCKVEKQP
jgi:hypothetical protein